MLIKDWLWMFALVAPLILVTCSSYVGKSESPVNAHRFASGSVTIKLPEQWIAEQNKFQINKFEVLSNARLKVGRDPPDGAMGRFYVEIVVKGGAAAEQCAARLQEAGGAPEGAEIEEMEINGRPAARMAAEDEMFGQKYRWRTTLIQFEDDIVVCADFTALGRYEENGVIDKVIETLVVDSAAFKAALEME
jgi:hypothetical protein